MRAIHLVKKSVYMVTALRFYVHKVYMSYFLCPPCGALSASNSLKLLFGGL